MNASGGRAYGMGMHDVRQIRQHMLNIGSLMWAQAPVDISTKALSLPMLSLRICLPARSEHASPGDSQTTLCYSQVACQGHGANAGRHNVELTIVPRELPKTVALRLLVCEGWSFKTRSAKSFVSGLVDMHLCMSQAA